MERDANFLHKTGEGWGDVSWKIIIMGKILTRSMLRGVHMQKSKQMECLFSQ